ncbi:MAG: hypothetical protein HY842_15755 [Bacteroidetes bacterium]|nr:hypothetical protein [Bacteroidota bacterium]
MRQEVFELPAACDLVLEETMPDGPMSQRVWTGVLDLKAHAGSRGGWEHG